MKPSQTINFDQLASHLGIDSEDFIELVELLITTSLSDIENIEKGVETNDHQLTSGAAHSIKGAAGNLGFSEISAAAAAIEMTARSTSFNGVMDQVQQLKSWFSDLKHSIEGEASL